MTGTLVGAAALNEGLVGTRGGRTRLETPAAVLDLDLFEQAVRGRVGAPTAGFQDEIAEAGLALARAHTELALAQVRAQAAAARADLPATDDVPPEPRKQILQ